MNKKILLGLLGTIIISFIVALLSQLLNIPKTSLNWGVIIEKSMTLSARVSVPVVLAIWTYMQKEQDKKHQERKDEEKNKVINQDKEHQERKERDKEKQINDKYNKKFGLNIELIKHNEQVNDYRKNFQLQLIYLKSIEESNDSSLVLDKMRVILDNISNIFKDMEEIFIPFTKEGYNNNATWNINFTSNCVTNLSNQITQLTNYSTEEVPLHYYKDLFDSYCSGIDNYIKTSNELYIRHLIKEEFYVLLELEHELNILFEKLKMEIENDLYRNSAEQYE